jgi:hypothetical protein
MKVFMAAILRSQRINLTSFERLPILRHSRTPNAMGTGWEFINHNLEREAL